MESSDRATKWERVRRWLARVAVLLVVLGCAVIAGVGRWADAARDPCAVDGTAATLRESIPSPDGRRTALAILSSGGATTPTAVTICVEEAGERRMLAWSGRSGGPTMRWSSSTELDVDELRRDEPSHRFDVTLDRPSLLLPRDGSIGCSATEPCSELYHCAIDDSCWRDGYDPDPAVVRTAALRREGIAVEITFHESADRIDTFRLIDAGGDAYEATRHHYPDGEPPAAVALTPSERAALLTAVARLRFTEHEEPRALEGCARIVRSRNWHTDFAVVCSPDRDPLLDLVAPLLGRTWP